MSLTIDNRERDLIEIIGNENITKTNLDIGDIIISNHEQEEILIERKTIKDLVASIKDGRYKEQKLRILNSKFKDKIIIYLLEGSIPASGKVQGIPVSTIISTIVKITLRDRIHVLRTLNADESAKIILKMKEKIGECISAPCVLDETINEEPQQDCATQYASTIQSKKKANITPQICFIAQLCQVPGIAKETAIAISEHFKNMSELCRLVGEKKEEAFVDIRVGKRNSKLSKKIVQLLCEYL